MKRELTEKLYKKYPKLFRQKDLPPQQTSMCFGFQCDDGWYWLIDKLCLKLQGYVDLNKKPQIEATTVKEKFGGLRFYVTGSDEYAEGLIDFACQLSYHICERCGSTQNVESTKGWIVTLCEECREEYKKKRGD